MKKNEKTNGGMDPARVALLLGVSVGLGIVVHEGFFLVAGVIAVGAAAAAIVNAAQDHAESTRLTHSHH